MLRLDNWSDHQYSPKEPTLREMAAQKYKMYQHRTGGFVSLGTHHLNTMWFSAVQQALYMVPMLYLFTLFYCNGGILRLVSCPEQEFFPDSKSYQPPR